jgi:tetraacyldisaccharide 4'-kinase
MQKLVYGQTLHGIIWEGNMTVPEFIYYLGYSIKKRNALKNRKRLPGRVVSIGNLTLGGTGKTPATIALAGVAKQKGFRPCILTRGYKGKTGGPVFVSRGERPLLNEYQAGDEALLMAKKLTGIPVIKAKDRYEAGMFALSSLPTDLCPDVFILDDGFQHWRLFRDKDILLIDGTNPFGNRRLFPSGSLREPISAAGRADVIVITKTDDSLRDRDSDRRLKSLIEEIKKYNKEAPIFFARHSPSRFITATGDTFPPEWAKAKKFFGFCGIGNPRSFQATLKVEGVEITGFRAFRDHYRYGSGAIRDVASQAKKSGADWIVTTEKDIIRLKDPAIPENLVALAVEFTVDEGFYEEVFADMQASRQSREG